MQRFYGTFRISLERPGHAQPYPTAPPSPARRGQCQTRRPFAGQIVRLTSVYQTWRYFRRNSFQQAHVPVTSGIQEWPGCSGIYRLPVFRRPYLATQAEDVRRAVNIDTKKLFLAITSCRLQTPRKLQILTREDSSALDGRWYWAVLGRRRVGCRPRHVD